MEYKNPDIAELAERLKNKLKGKADRSFILRDPELKAKFAEISLKPTSERAEFGRDLNKLKSELEELVEKHINRPEDLKPIDVTAPFDVNTLADKRPRLLSSQSGSTHPLMKELEKVLDIFARMGFTAVESRQLDDDWHMFTSLNFPEGHPARDDYDTFLTEEKDKNGKPFVAPAHVSVMQNRLQKMYKPNLEQGKPIAVVYTGRTFRNEDVDARHEHTFYQVEITYIDKNIHAGNLIATFKTFLQEYYQQELDVKTQPFYFPFTEPSFEFAMSCPFCQKKGCSICSQSGWIEILGCGMINPYVLKMGGIDPAVYTGFAGGMGLDRLVMMKNSIEDVRHFHSGKLDFLRQFR